MCCKTCYPVYIAAAEEDPVVGVLLYAEVTGARERGRARKRKRRARARQRGEHLELRRLGSLPVVGEEAAAEVT